MISFLVKYIKPFFLLLVLFIITFLRYLPAIDGRFTSDFYNWVRDYEHGSISELWLCFGYPGLHQLYHIPFYFSYKLFGLNAMAWHLEFTFLHALNAFLVYYLAKEFLSLINKDKKFALVTSLLFLLSPFQTEVVAWGATIHYLFTLIFFLSSFLFLIKYLKNKQTKYLILFHFFYILDLFTMELPLVFPGIFILFSLVTMSHYKVKLKTVVINLLLINTLTIISYFLLTKIIIGSYIGHYGAESHLIFNISSASNVLYDYFLKFLVFFRYIDTYSIKKFLENVFHNDGFKIISFSLISIILLKNIFFSYKKKKTILFFVLLNIVFFAISLLPVLNIEMSSMKALTTDRYSYVSSVFFLIGITLIFSSFQKNISIALSFIYLFINISLLSPTITIWKENGILANKIIDSYTFYDEKVYAINNIDMYKGAYLFKNGFVAAIELQKGKMIKGNYHEIGKIYSTSLLDSVSIAKKENELTAELIKWGRWLWLKESDKNYNVRLGFMGQSVIIEPKEKIKIIYLKAGEWQVLD